MIQVGIIGGAGYTAGELIRLLLFHSKVNLNFVYSTSNAGNQLSVVHQDLVGDTTLAFTDEINTEVDVLFLCLGHGNSKVFLKNHIFSEDTKIIDLSHDFRMQLDSEYRGDSFVYGLPECNRETILTAQYIANPGCFATAIQLGLLPLSKAGLLNESVHINAVTGATGAGTALSDATHFTWRDNNFSHYKPFVHQHLEEVDQNLKMIDPTFSSELYFLPNRGNFSRGIFATAYTRFEGDIDTASKLYKTYYENAPFTVVSDHAIHLKQVVNTNKCLIHLHKHKDVLLITSCIDNLLKGASGQAIQNMNITCNFPEAEGLRLKATYF